MGSPNSRVDLRISNPEKAAWQACADERGMTLTEMIKQSVRVAVTDHNANLRFDVATGEIVRGVPTSV